MTPSLLVTRRAAFVAAAAASISSGAEAADEPSWKASNPAIAATSAALPLVLTRTEFVYEALLDLAPSLQLGNSPFGERRMVPITGGPFEGPGLRGRVMPGGADRQLVRRDGVVNLDATYELETNDGIVISVRNRVLSRQPKEPANAPRYSFSTLDIVAPEGRYAWLNDWTYVGTLHGLRPRPNALIRVYKVL